MILAHLPDDPAWARAAQSLREAGGETVEIVHGAQARADRIVKAEILLSFALSAQEAGSAPALRWIQSLGSGTDAIAVDPGGPTLLTNMAGINAASVAEAVMAAILSYARDLPGSVRAQAEHRWAPQPARLVRDMRIGIVGTGAIAIALAARLAPFGARIEGFSNAPRSIAGFHAVLARDFIATVAGDLDVLVLLTSLNDRSRHLVDAPLLNTLKTGALLVNYGRGALVDEDALADELTTGRLSAALDVFEREPLAVDSPLWSASNTLITPHSAGLRHGYADEAMTLFLNNLGAYRSGDIHQLRNRVHSQRC